LNSEPDGTCNITLLGSSSLLTESISTSEGILRATLPSTIAEVIPNKNFNIALSPQIKMNA
tara:strand:- start:293 stop:475 length:183 start_codon:yes stop_codon:yes gene_type:complete